MATRTAHDLVITGGRVIDPANRIDAVTDVAVAQGRISAIGPGLTGTTIVNAAGRIVTPGLIDLHTHVYWGGTSLGVDPLAYGAAGAITTLVDTGSAGPGNFAGFRAHVIAPCPLRILVYLHVSHAGIFGFSRRVSVGESEDIRLMDPITAVEVARAHPDLIVGIKVRLGRHASGQQGMTPFAFALQVAEAAGLPLMVHIDEPPPSYAEIVAALRPGDVLTHCFRPFPNTPLTGDGTVRPEVLAARARGVFFDIGHGMGSFSFATARAMLGQGFPPDSISSDVHALCIDGPAFDLVTTMNKLLALGMPLPDVIAAATQGPARIVNRPLLGNLAVGSPADISVLRIADTPVTLSDVGGETLDLAAPLVPEAAFIGGIRVENDLA